MYMVTPGNRGEEASYEGSYNSQDCFAILSCLLVLINLSFMIYVDVLYIYDVRPYKIGVDSAQRDRLGCLSGWLAEHF